MFYSNGDGVEVYGKNGNLVVSCKVNDRRWTAEVPYLNTNTWHFIEYTFHPDKGLRVFVNNRERARDQNPETVPVGQISIGNVLIGRPNADDDAGGRYGNFVIDEFEVYAADRDYLLAWNYIERGTFGRSTFVASANPSLTIVSPDTHTPVRLPASPGRKWLFAIFCISTC